MDVVNNKEGNPLEYYLERFRACDIEETAARCGLSREENRVAMGLLGEMFTVSHPDFTVVGPSPLTNAERILLLRYLVDGRAAVSGGQYLT